MQTYDLAMIGIVLFTTILGFVKGLAWQIASVAALVVSFLVALRFSPDLAPYLSHEEPWNRFLAMAVLYMATSLAIWMAFRFVSKLIERIKLKEFDRQIGGLFGIAQGVLICVALTFFAVTLTPQTRQLVMASQSGHYIVRLINQADPIMPRELHQVLDPYLDRLESELTGDTPAQPMKDRGPGPVRPVRPR